MPEISSIRPDQTSYQGYTSTAPEQKSSSKRAGGDKELSAEQKKQVQELKKRDIEVRAHESAHSAAGGQYIRGGASYEYQTGPDGQRYAVGGEVSIDTSPVRDDPRATIMKMQAVKRAALAPASPSGQDRAVASAAAAAQAQAYQELSEQTRQKVSGSGDMPEKTGADTGSEKKSFDGYTEKGTTSNLNSAQYTQIDIVF